MQAVRDHSADAQIGWGDLYYHVMPKVLNDNNCLIGAEIGVAFGGHAESILQNTSINKIYCIDSYKHYPGSTDSFCLLNGQTYGQPEYDTMYEFTKERLDKFNNRAILIREESEAASKLINETLDFVFIDAQHTPQAVINDINLWYPKIKNGGVMSGHDYNHPCFPGVAEAVNSFFNGKSIHAEDGYVWWVIKN